MFAESLARDAGLSCGGARGKTRASIPPIPAAFGVPSMASNLPQCLQKAVRGGVARLNNRLTVLTGCLKASRQNTLKHWCQNLTGYLEHDQGPFSKVFGSFPDRVARNFTGQNPLQRICIYVKLWLRMCKLRFFFHSIFSQLLCSIDSSITLLRREPSPSLTTLWHFSSGVRACKALVRPSAWLQKVVRELSQISVHFDARRLLARAGNNAPFQDRVQTCRATGKPGLAHVPATHVRAHPPPLEPKAWHDTQLSVEGTRRPVLISATRLAGQCAGMASWAAPGNDRQREDTGHSRAIQSLTWDAAHTCTAKCSL